MKILALLHTQEDGSLPKAALEVLAAAAALKGQPGGSLAVGIIGQGAAGAADTVAGCGAERFLTVGAETVAQPRYATDTAAAAALIKESGAELVVAPGTARFARCLPGAAHRAGARLCGGGRRGAQEVRAGHRTVGAGHRRGPAAGDPL